MSILFLSKLFSLSVPAATFSRVINEMIGQCPEKATKEFDQLHSFDRQTLKRLLLLEKFVKQSLQDFDPRDRHKIAAQFEQCQHAFYAFREALDGGELQAVQYARHALIIAVDMLDLIKIEHGQFAGKVVAHAVTQAQLPQGRNYQEVTRLIGTYVDGPKRTRPREFWSGASLEEALGKKDQHGKTVKLVGATVELGKKGAITILQDQTEGPADSATRTLSGKKLDGTLYSIVIQDGISQVQKMYVDLPSRQVTGDIQTQIYAIGDSLKLTIPGTLLSQTDTFTVVSDRQDGDSRIIRVFKGKDIFELTLTAEGQWQLTEIGKLSSAKVGRVYYAEDPAMVKAPYAHDPGVLAAIGDSSDTFHPLLVKEPKDKDGKPLPHTDPREMTGEKMRIHLQATAARYGDHLTFTPDGKIVSDTMTDILNLDPANAAGLNRHNRYNRGLYGVNAAIDGVLVFTDPDSGKVRLKAIVRGDMFHAQIHTLNELLANDQVVITDEVLRHGGVDGLLKKVGVDDTTKLKPFLKDLEAACSGGTLNATALEKYFAVGTKLYDIAAKITDLFESLRSAITEVHNEVLKGSGSKTRPSRHHIKDVLNALKVKIAYPGGMVEGKDNRLTIAEELSEELGLGDAEKAQLHQIVADLDLQLVFQGINTDDTRNTLCSSMGTSAFLVDLNQRPDLERLVKPEGADTDALTSKFVEINSSTICEMAFSHGSYMAQVLAHKIDIAEDELRRLQSSDPSTEVKGTKRKPDNEKATQDRITLLNTHIKHWQGIINAFIRHYSTKAPKFKAHATRLEELPRPLTDTMTELPTPVELGFSRHHFPHKKLANLRNERLLEYLQAQAEAEMQGKPAEGKVHKQLLYMVKELIKRTDLSRGHSLQFDQSLNESIWTHSPDSFKVLILDWLHQEYKAHVPNSERSWVDFLSSAFGEPVLSQVQDYCRENVVKVLGIAGIVKEARRQGSQDKIYKFMGDVWKNTSDQEKLEVLNAFRLALPSKDKFGRGEGEYKKDSTKGIRFNVFLEKYFNEDTRAKVLEFCVNRNVYTKYINPNSEEVYLNLGDGGSVKSFESEGPQMGATTLNDVTKRRSSPTGSMKGVLPPSVQSGVLTTLKGLSRSSGSLSPSISGAHSEPVHNILPPPEQFAASSSATSTQNSAPPPPPPLPVVASVMRRSPDKVNNPIEQGSAPAPTFFEELNAELLRRKQATEPSSDVDA